MSCLPPTQFQPLPHLLAVGLRDQALPQAAGGVRKGFPGHCGRPGLIEDQGQPGHAGSDLKVLHAALQAALMGTGIATSRFVATS